MECHTGTSQAGRAMTGRRWRVAVYFRLWVCLQCPFLLFCFFFGVVSTLFIMACHLPSVLWSCTQLLGVLRVGSNFRCFAVYRVPACFLFLLRFSYLVLCLMLSLVCAGSIPCRKVNLKWYSSGQALGTFLCCITSFERVLDQEVFFLYPDVPS